MNERTQPILTLLREVPLFSGLTIEEMESLSEEFVMVELPKGEMLYRNQEATDGLFVVDAGQLELLDEEGKQLEVLTHGEVIGTEALNYLPTRQNSALALTDSRVYFLPNKQIQAVYADVPTFK